MRDTVIIGGGLSGLAAAYTLEKANVNYTLIEVKRRLGGSIHSIQQDGFIIDTGEFATTALPDELLTDLELQNALFTLSERHRIYAFKSGTQTLIDAFTRKITAPRMMRMAVSSIGHFENTSRLGLCLENGLALDAKAIIVAIPAYYAERLFYSYLPEVAKYLHNYHYDRILKIALGYHSTDVPTKIPLIPDLGYVYTYQTTQQERVPSGKTLVHIGIRMNPDNIATEQLIATIQHDTVLKAEPLSIKIAHQPHADSLDCHSDEYRARMQKIQILLPEHIALIGSDYSIQPTTRRGVYNLADRIQQGVDAAQKIIAALN